MEEKVKEVEIIEEEQAKEGDEDTTPDGYPPYPYQFNVCRSILLYPLGPTQSEWGKEPPTPEDMKEKIRELEKVSKPCVNVITDGIHSCSLMSKYLEARVDGLLHNIGLMIDNLNNNTSQLEFLTQVVDDRHVVIEEMRKHFRSIFASCQDTQ